MPVARRHRVVCATTHVSQISGSGMGVDGRIGILPTTAGDRVPVEDLLREHHVLDGPQGFEARGLGERAEPHGAGQRRRTAACSRTPPRTS